MTPKQIARHLQQQFGDAITEVHIDDKHPRVHTTSEHWRDIAEHLRRDDAMHFDWLSCLSGVDYVIEDQLCAVYDMRSMTHEHEFAVKVYCHRNDPHIPSVVDLWPGADWHEREAFDMFGILFDGHPDLRRILLPEDWSGHPLRKDYVFPREYHGIPGTYELDWQQDPDYPG